MVSRRIFVLAMSPPSSTFTVVVVLLFGVFLSGGRCEVPNKANDLCFSFDGSEKNRSFDSEFTLYGDAQMSGSAVRITRPANSSTGRIAHRKAIRFLGTKPGFSSSFSFSISPGDGGSLLSFFLESVEGDGFGLSTSLVAVRFGTSGNRSGSLIEIDVGGEALMTSSNLSDVGLLLNSGEKLRSWIDYDGESKRMEVRLSQAGDPRPTANCSINLSSLVWKEAVFVGISSWSGNSTETSSLYSWNFTVKQGAPYLMHSEPLNPNSFLVRPTESPPSVHQRKAYAWGVLMAMVFAAACGATLAFSAMFVWAALVARRPVSPVECPVEDEYGKIVSAGDERLVGGKK
ncbi:hypothetical protein C4D60_Mb10t24530 [Musa balbisiana]|uniref:Legume lectin domain-containing protein n=1 Tax=Musa balbisiana TaxID=52838 RepID=A0A4S8IZL7_MUSBA|nr:hypothetical protein C4D60_Mb10t24530 [Musa balbisiana]